jgi:trans-aconitate methyltransferase
LSSKLLTEYTALAGSYDQRWSRYLDASLAMTLEFIPEPAATQIFDVACGTGLLLQARSNRFDDPQLTGIDIEFCL